MLFILFLCSVMTATISGVVGMAGGVSLLALMTLFLPLQAVIPIHGAVQLVSNFSRTFYLRNNIRRDVFIAFLISAPFGAMISYFLIREIDFEPIALIIILVFILYVLFKPKELPQLKLALWQFSILGFCAGLLGILIGATGPLLAPFFLRDDFLKEEIVATKGAVQALIHFIKLPVFFLIGFDYWGNKNLIFVMIIGVLIGTKIGVELLKKMSAEKFVFVYKAVLFLVALRLFYKIF